MTSACTIRIIRKAGYSDFVRRYQIFANGIEVGSIARNSVLEFKVPSGATTIYAKIDWGLSAPLTVTATPEKRIEIEVSNNWGALRGLWAVTFGRKSYLILRPNDVA